MTGEELFTMFVKSNLSTRGGLQGYVFEALSDLEQLNWQRFADSIAALDRKDLPFRRAPTMCPVCGDGTNCANNYSGGSIDRCPYGPGGKPL